MILDNWPLRLIRALLVVSLVVMASADGPSDPPQPPPALETRNISVVAPNGQRTHLQYTARLSSSTYVLDADDSVRSVACSPQGLVVEITVTDAPLFRRRVRRSTVLAGDHRWNCTDAQGQRLRILQTVLRPPALHAAQPHATFRLQTRMAVLSEAFESLQLTFYRGQRTPEQAHGLLAAQAQPSAHATTEAGPRPSAKAPAEPQEQPPAPTSPELRPALPTPNPFRVAEASPAQSAPGTYSSGPQPSGTGIGFPDLIAAEVPEVTSVHSMSREAAEDPATSQPLPPIPDGPPDVDAAEDSEAAVSETGRRMPAAYIGRRLMGCSWNEYEKCDWCLWSDCCSCHSCHWECQTCDGGDEDDCNSCNSDRHFYDGYWGDTCNPCLHNSHCSAGHYCNRADTVSDSYNQWDCKQCGVSQCRSCSTSGSCSACNHPYHLHTGTLTDSCNQCTQQMHCSTGTYCDLADTGSSAYSSWSCKSCGVSRCTACSSYSSCTACQSGYHPYDGFRSDSCELCLTTSHCSPGSYCNKEDRASMTYDKYECVQCDSRCAACNRDGCTSCKAGYHLHKGLTTNTCEQCLDASHCGTGEYCTREDLGSSLSKKWECQPCDSKCASCNGGGASACTSCISGPRPHLSTVGTCEACLEESHCPHGYTCTSGEWGSTFLSEWECVDIFGTCAKDMPPKRSSVTRSDGKHVVLLKSVTIKKHESDGVLGSGGEQDFYFWTHRGSKHELPCLSLTDDHQAFRNIDADVGAVACDEALRFGLWESDSFGSEWLGTSWMFDDAYGDRWFTTLDFLSSATYLYRGDKADFELECQGCHACASAESTSNPLSQFKQGERIDVGPVNVWNYDTQSGTAIEAFDLVGDSTSGGPSVRCSNCYLGIPSNEVVPPKVPGCGRLCVLQDVGRPQWRLHCTSSPLADSSHPNCQCLLRINTAKFGGFDPVPARGWCTRDGSWSSVRPSLLSCQWLGLGAVR